MPENSPPPTPSISGGQMLGKAWRTHPNQQLGIYSLFSSDLKRFLKLGNQEVVDFMRFSSYITSDHLFYEFLSVRSKEVGLCGSHLYKANHAWVILLLF